MKDTRNVISSPESGDGPTPSSLPDGPQIDLFGPEAAPVSPSQSLEKAWVKKMNGTYGLPGYPSSPSGDLQRSLENRLQARMGENGSPEYELTWSRWGMRSGVPICALRASGLRTSGKGFGGWPTPTKSDWMPFAPDTMERKERGDTRPSGARIGYSNKWNRKAMSGGIHRGVYGFGADMSANRGRMGGR